MRANRGSVGRMPALSSVLAGRSSTSSSEPCLSQTTQSLMPLTSLAPSKPRAQALGAERSERLSTTTAEGRTSSPQAKRQSKAKRCPSRRHSPRRVQRANALCSVVKGMPERQPAIRHCMPPKVSIQINPIRRRRRVRSGLRPRRCTPIRSRSMASSSASTAKMNTSISARMFQPSPRLGRGTGRAEGGGRSAGLKRLACDIGPIWCGGSGALPYVSGPT
jgi:hypothetical protein